MNYLRVQIVRIFVGSYVSLFGYYMFEEEEEEEEEGEGEDFVFSCFRLVFQKFSYDYLCQ